MFGRGNKETNELLRAILGELRQIRPQVVPAAPGIMPSVTKNILARPLARDNSIMLGDSLVSLLNRSGQSLDSITRAYASFDRADLEEALGLLVDRGALTTGTTRTTVEGVSAIRIIYRGVE